MMSDLTERVLIALEESTRVTTEVIGHVKGLTREFEALRESYESTNTHLDSLVHETKVTNELLREDMANRKAELSHQRELEKEDREWRRNLETRKLNRQDQVQDDTRDWVKKWSQETWETFKHPLGYLVAGVIFWLVTTYFAVPPPTLVQPPVTIVAPDSP
jgi:hypothetical protein